MTGAGEILCEVRDVHFAYSSAPVLRGVDLECGRGEFLGIIGPNGSGKTTLLRLLVGAHRPGRGSVIYRGQDISSFERRELAREVAFVSQETPVHFPFTAMEIVLMGRYPHQGPFVPHGREDVRIAEEALECTGSSEFRNRVVTELSGGERQRVFLASALAQEPRLLILDEPTHSLDLKYVVEIYRTLEQLRAKRDLTLIMVTHELNEAAEQCERIALFNHGKVEAVGRPAEILTRDRLAQTYEVDVDVETNQRSGSPVILPVSRKQRGESAT